MESWVCLRGGKGGVLLLGFRFYWGGGCSVIPRDNHKMAAHDYKSKQKEDKTGETEKQEQPHHSGILLAQRWNTNKHIHG